MTTKTKIWANCTTTYSREEAASTEGTWISYKAALETFGQQELKARVQAKTIECRPSPSDSRFPEFRLLKESDRTTTYHTKSMEATGSSDMSRDQYKKIMGGATVDLCSLDFGDFQDIVAGQLKDNQAEEDDDGHGLANKLLGTNKPSKRTMEERLETCSVLEDKNVNPDVVFTKLTHMKSIVDKLAEQMQRAAFKDEGAAKTLAPHIKGLHGACDTIRIYLKKDRATMQKVSYKKLQSDMKNIKVVATNAEKSMKGTVTA